MVGLCYNVFVLVWVIVFVCDRFWREIVLNQYKLTPAQIEAIERTVSRGDRVEIVPVEGGLRLLRTRRETIRVTDTSTNPVKV